MPEIQGNLESLGWCIERLRKLTFGELREHAKHLKKKLEFINRLSTELPPIIGLQGSVEFECHHN